MFGQHHDDNSPKDQVVGPTNIADDGTLGISPLGSDSVSAPSVSPSSNEPNGGTTSLPPLPQTFRQSPPPSDADSPAVTPAAPIPAEVLSKPSPSLDSPGSSSAIAHHGAGSNDLIAIKQEALQHLKPLVGHLDQTPEEKFRTTMMMIQAADDQSLIQEAYDDAKAITDEKARAQALLDVVNEINYFHSQSPQQP